MTNDLAMGVRFLWGIRGFLGHVLSLSECEEQVRQQHRQRQDAFLLVLKRGIFDYPDSPYRKLFAHYGILYEDVARMVHDWGVEATLGRLYDAGIYVTLDQFKGRAPIERPGFYLETRSADFDSPILSHYFDAETGGSGGAPRRLRIDLDILGYEGAYNLIVAHNLGLQDRPFAMWRPIPPASAGFKDVFRRSKVGLAIDRWFSQNETGWRVNKHASFTRLAIAMSRLCGASMAMPEYVPSERADRVARWMAEQTAAGCPAFISLSGSSGVRVCTSAKALGLDISGSVFRMGGEPHTEAKARIVAEAGATSINHYSMSEIGRVGLACAQPSVLDDIHLLTDKLALIQRQPPQVKDDRDIGAFYLTTLMPIMPKIMLNVETGDYGTIEERDCGCALSKLGLMTHIHTIRSYEKLTTEGMHFTGTDLLRLVEELLPKRFGGGPADYQLVEEEANGLARVLLVVSPRVGQIDEQEVKHTALNALGARDKGTAMMVDIWEKAGTLQVVRREPYATSSAKIQPLHVHRS